MQLKKSRIIAVLFSVFMGQLPTVVNAFTPADLSPMAKPQDASARELFINTDLKRARLSLEVALDNAPQYSESADVTAIEAARTPEDFILMESNIELFRKTSSSTLEFCSAKAGYFQSFEIDRCNLVTNFEYIFRGILVEMKLNQKFFESLTKVLNNNQVFARILKSLNVHSFEKINRMTLHRSTFSDDFGLFKVKIDILAQRGDEIQKCAAVLDPQIQSLEVTKNNYRSLSTINFFDNEDLICVSNRRSPKN